jgi:hypothetical protein
MLTPRERATSAYRAAVAQGRSRIFGVDDMVSVTEARLANVQQAQRAITQASAAERHFHSEPDDSTRCATAWTHRPPRWRATRSGGRPGSGIPYKLPRCVRGAQDRPGCEEAGAVRLL